MPKAIGQQQRIIFCFISLISITVIYAPTLSNNFLANWDDQWMVTKNPYLNEFSLSAMVSIFTESYGGQYSPLNTLMYLIITEVTGLESWVFHLVSLLLHLTNFFLVGLFLEKLLAMINKIRLNGKLATYIAWGAALLFAIHPMQVESVAWISASKVLLYSFFYLLGLLGYLYYKDTGERKYFWLTLLFFLCSLLSKEQAVVFILSLVAVDMVTATNIKEKKLWLEKIPFLVLAALFSGFTLWLQNGGFGSTDSYPFYQRFAFANYSFWEYLIKLLIPYHLSHFYFFPMDIGGSMPLRFWFYPVATIILGWLLIEYRQHINRIYLFGSLFFLINLILVLHLIPITRYAIIADRYIYLSSIGFFLIVAYIFVNWLKNSKIKSSKFVFGCLSIYLLVLGSYTHQRTKVWNNMETLNRDVEETVEEHIGDINYLERLMNKSQYEDTTQNNE